MNVKPCQTVSVALDLIDRDLNVTVLVFRTGYILPRENPGFGIIIEKFLHSLVRQIFDDIFL